MPPALLSRYSRICVFTQEVELLTKMLSCYVTPLIGGT